MTERHSHLSSFEFRGLVDDPGSKRHTTLRQLETGSSGLRSSHIHFGKAKPDSKDDGHFRDFVQHKGSIVHHLDGEITTSRIHS